MSAVEDWLEAARCVRVQDELARRGLWSARMAGDNGVPCPGCGGRDRFAVNTKKNVWLCRASGEAGDAIALARHIDGTGFRAAVETVLGRPPPGRGPELTGQELQAIAKRAEDARHETEEKRRAAEKSSAWFRERERRAAWDLWNASHSIRATAAEDYLVLRGLEAPAGARLRFHPCQPYFEPKAQGGMIVHEGPALLAAIEGTNGRFAGVHRTWIDLAQSKGKTLITHPSTGEILPAKKVRGSVRGGSILLVRGGIDADFPGDRRGPQRLILGEGIETVLAVYTALRQLAWPLFEGSEFRAAISLGNLAGRAAGRVRHPTETRIDKRGRVRPHFIADSEPLDDPAWPVIPLAETLRELVLLGDGDSEPVFTRMAMKRAGKRFARIYPRILIKLAMAPLGMDFNEMLTGRKSEVAA